MHNPRSTEDLLKMELISLDERLCRALDRTQRLCDQAEKREAIEEVDLLHKVNKILASTKRSLERLA